MTAPGSKHLGLLCLLISVAACGTEATPAWNEESGYRWRELKVPKGQPGFTQLSGSRTGVTFQNTVSDSVLLGNRVLAQGGGIAIGDVDGDGLTDLFLARTQGCNALYRNRGNWRFEDITTAAGVGACDRYSSGSAFADMDGDRDLDLILLATTGPNAIFINDGAGRFTERRDLGLDTVGRGGTTVALADVDGNGSLDVYVANYKPFTIEDTIPPQDRAFSQMVRQIGPNQFDIVPEHRENYKLVLRPDMGGLRMTVRAEPDDFYLNNGGRLTRVDLAAGRFRDNSGKPQSEEAESFGLVARFADLNGDGSPDLYVANDFEDADELWLNDGAGIFRRAPWTAQRQISNSSMGADVADVNADGLPDLFTLDMLSNDARRLKTQIPTHTALPKHGGDIETQLQQQRNTLFTNRGDGTFAEVGYYANVEASGWSWSAMFLDVDLDGWQDILIANGHLWDIMDADTHERLQNRLTGVPWRRSRWEFPRLALKNVALRNRGDLTFEDAGAAWRFGVEEDVSHALAAGDLDGDGDLDVVVNRLGAPALVLRHDGDGPRVAVRLVGDAPNTFAVGATIKLHGGAVATQVREVTAGGLYLSHSDHVASFAMDTATRATLVVDWRDGRRTVIDNVRPNRLYEISTATAAPKPPADSTKLATLFVDATAELGGHTHADANFDDWKRQFLLPNSLSQLGPGVSWFDYDGDGDEDLFVGAGRGGKLGVWRNDGRRLTRQTGQGPTAEFDFTTPLGLASGAGRRLLLGVSNWEVPGPEEAVRRTPAVVSVAAGASGVAATTASLLPGAEASTGPMALGDYDGDGDLDLFVGGRAVPGRYPAAASSTLSLNVDGRFVADSTNAGLLRGIGLVSAASFADMDGDGDADLLLAREWSSIALLINERGVFRAAPSSWGLDRWTGRWNGLATGDLDGDGRLDIVATGWGDNTMTPADSANPLVMFHGPIGPRGEEEMLLARHDATLGALSPLNSFARVRITIPDLSDRVRTFGEYAGASIDQVLGPLKAKVRSTSVATLAHMTFLNRGDRFEATRLPMEAQLAPAFFAGIADFDGDGFEDVFLSQNFYPTALGIPRYDAGRSLLLSGNGRGTLTAQPAARTGLLVYGDQRGAAYADFDRDGRTDLVVSQNGAETRLYRNRGAVPGLRVRLVGPAQNPLAIGAQVRIVFGDRMGPVREVQAGSGYWSQNAATQVFGLAAAPTAVWVRWPGGTETRTPITPGAREITITR